MRQGQLLTPHGMIQLIYHYPIAWDVSAPSREMGLRQFLTPHGMFNSFTITQLLGM